MVKQVWKTPQLEVLDVSMTMKWWGDNVGAEPEDPNGEDSGNGENPLDS